MAVMKATRDAFGETLVKLGEKYPEVVVLDADLAKSTKSEAFLKAFPDRFFEMGIAEANMIGTAAGLALAGKVSFACSFACFITGRFDQIRISVAYANANVRVVGSHAGVAIGEDGYSQMGLEDVALMRSLPGMVVMQPADDVETAAMMEYLCTHQGPAYLRTTRQKLERVNPEDYTYRFGKAVELRQGGTDAVIFATGGEVAFALHAAEALAKEGHQVGVVNVHTLKPLDTETILRLSEQARLVVTAEDHQVIGGLGSAVAETLAEAGLGRRLVRIGLQDVFGESGTPEQLLRHFQLDAEGIAAQVRGALQGV
ncbi:MAG TPA: transketolase C-terminal domain-containing protein [Myxococcaceae bacterium]|nr:transketolase C-terminal domain-containing protein [Myxococcaceae bacterium]